MNLTDMQTSFYKHTSSLTSDLTASEVNVYLNTAYQYTIPLDVGGEFNEQIWEIVCVPNHEWYPYPPTMVAPRAGEPWIDETEASGNRESIGIVYLTRETDPVIFKRKYLSRSSSGRPTAILFYGKVATLSAPPSEEYIVSVPIRGGPIVGIPVEGIAHGTHAQAVVAAAALDYLTEIEDVDDPGTLREGSRYKRFRDQLKTYALARPMTRSYTRSF